MAVPKSCRECPDEKNCRSYYGGSLCKHKDAIYEVAMKAAGIQLLRKKELGNKSF